MRRIHVLVEGQTEETFVRDTLAPYLATRDIYATSVLLTTKRVAGGPNYRGGLTSWHQVEREARQLLGDTSAARVTTVIDVYGLPPGWPGVDSAPADPYAMVKHIEGAMASAIRDPRFIPYLSLHEFEALLYVDPDRCEHRAARTGVAAALQAALVECGSPELIDRGPQTAPSKRLGTAWPGFAKVVDGPAIAADIGLDRLRAACPHFHAWVATLEAI